MNYYKLICESDFNEYDVITEATKDGKGREIKIRGPFMCAEKLNANGRVYPKEILKPQADKFLSEMVHTGRALGELEHPEYAHINPAESAIRITKLEEQGNTWIGEAIVLCSDHTRGIIGTPKGDILASLLQHGTRMGVSSRGVGNLDESKSKVIDYTLVTLDVVGQPSIGMYIDGILESKEYIIDAKGIIAEAAYNEIEKKLANTPRTSKDEILAKAVRDFMKKI
jgi:hypothetical protein